MGDTAIFSDMGLINEIYRPDIGIVPIGDRFTMGAKTAALACKRFFQFERVDPLPLRDLSHHRPDGRQIRRGNGRQYRAGAQGRRPLRGLSSALRR